MKLPLFFFVTEEVSGGYYQQHQLLSLTEKRARQAECLAKAEETKDKFSIENGSWHCPEVTESASKLKCFPRCDLDMKPDWTWRPKRDRPRFMIRCGSPATVAKWNLPEGTELSCSPKPPHPCISKAGQTTIERGQLSLNTKINKSRAIFDLICDDGENKGRVYCVRNIFKRPNWQKSGWKKACCATDPCAGLENCETFVDGCAVTPVTNNNVATVPAALNYKVSADVFCDHSMPIDGQWKSVLFFGNPENNAERVFSILRRPSEQKLAIVLYDPNANNKFSDYQSFILDCDDGSWNTYTVEVNQLEGAPTTVQYSLTVNGEEIGGSSYDSTAALSTGDLEAFVAKAWNSDVDPATAYSVRNFYYQTFEETPLCASDPCFGLENCETFVDGCAVTPVRDNQVATVTAALNYKVSADVFCDNSMPIDEHWKTILFLGNPENGAERVFTIRRKSFEKKLGIVIYNPNANNKFSDYESFIVDCVDGSWNTYTVEVNQLEESPTTLQYTLTIDGEQIGVGSYESTSALSSGDLDAMVGRDFRPATSYSVRNFYYQILPTI